MTRLPILRTALPIILAVGLGHAAWSEPNRVQFPDKLDALEHYTTVTRGEVIAHSHEDCAIIAQ